MCWNQKEIQYSSENHLITTITTDDYTSVPDLFWFGKNQHSTAAIFLSGPLNMTQILWSISGHFFQILMSFQPKEKTELWNTEHHICSGSWKTMCFQSTMQMSGSLTYDNGHLAAALGIH